MIVKVMSRPVRDARAAPTLSVEGEIASRIQTSILPRELAVEGIEIAAAMRPAESVGGDYYDVIPRPGGCWIAIGDVAGHGLQAGLVMFMVQGMLAALLRQARPGTPSEVLVTLNAALYENTRRRLRTDEHVTLCLMWYDADGAFVFAGAHEDILVYRATTTRCERIPTPGSWLGAVPDISASTRDTRAQLHPGDLMVLHTDGVTEARNADGEMFGLERLAAVVEAHGNDSAEQARRAIFEAVAAWTARQDDDLTVLVVGCRGVYW